MQEVIKFGVIYKKNNDVIYRQPLKHLSILLEP